jgi:hypothetical protein
MLLKYFQSVTRRRLFNSTLLILIAALSISTTVNIYGQQTAAPPAGGERPARDKIKRWFEVDAFTISTRYRFVRNNRDETTNNQQQFQVNSRAKFKLDKKGRLAVTAVLASGSSFNSGWNNLGPGTGDLTTNLYLKQLYFSARPVKEVEMQFGGLGFNNGENTEITGYDNDGYLVGERVTVRAPKHFYFDEISAANGFVGDSNKPSVFKRFHRLNESNYHQILVRKAVNKFVSFSADYTFEAGKDTLHQAIKFKLPKGKALNNILFENYQRFDPDVGYGFAIYGDKTLHTRLTVGGGFARIDRTILNADRFPPGKRLFANAVIKLTPEFSINPVIIQAVGDLPSPTSVRTRLDLIFTYNFLETLRRLKVQ